MEKKQELTREDTFLILFDIAVNDKSNWEDWALVELFGPPDNILHIANKNIKQWFNFKTRARQKLFQLFIEK